MKQWLSDNGVETESLDKKAVTELLKEAPDNLADVLTLRQQLAKSYVRKYQAMKKLYAAMVELVVCSNFMVLTEPGDFQVVIFSCRTFHKIIC